MEQKPVNENPPNFSLVIAMNEFCLHYIVVELCVAAVTDGGINID